jgi:hypothetical protein
MACHWDLVGVTGPQDPNTPKWACKTVKKPVISVDDLEDSGDEAPSPATDLAASVFAIRNAASGLVTESAAIQATFVQFQDTLAGSLDRLTEFLVKEHVRGHPSISLLPLSSPTLPLSICIPHPHLCIISKDHTGS